jgi:hypothetical protein
MCQCEDVGTVSSIGTNIRPCKSVRPLYMHFYSAREDSPASVSEVYLPPVTFAPIHPLVVMVKLLRVSRCIAFHLCFSSSQKVAGMTTFEVGVSSHDTQSGV